MNETSSSGLKVVALIQGPPQALELWTLRALAAAPCQLYVVRGAQAASVKPLRRLRGLVTRYGALATASRVLGARLIGRREDLAGHRVLDECLDGEELRRWWSGSGLVPVEVPHLNHAASRAAIAEIAPDLIIRVSGGLIKPEVFSLARLAAINIHHGQAPFIRGMWSIPWGIVEGRPDWIGATVHEIDAGIDTGRVLWRGSPQLAPGDTATDLFFRAHLEAVAALVRLLAVYSVGAVPPDWTEPGPADSAYRSAPGLAAWIRLLLLGRGRRAQILLERATRC